MLLIKWLQDVTLADLAKVGGKATNLGHLYQAGLPVPNGYCITTEAYDYLLQAHAEIIQTALANLKTDDFESYEQVSQQIQTVFEQMPFDLWQQIKAAQALLKEPVAVRSSATTEDLIGASFAGQQETWLDVASEAALKKAILKCFASLWSARAMQYRDRMGFAHQEAKLCVLIQEMVPARTAGVMFTANPLTGVTGDCVLEAVLGLGEGVVSGTAQVDRYLADKVTGQLKEANSIDPTRSVLKASEVAKLVKIGQQIEKLYNNSPQDIEWAFLDNTIYILQTRSLTALPKEPPVQLNKVEPIDTKQNINFIMNLVERLIIAPRPLEAELGAKTMEGLVATVGSWGIKFSPTVYVFQDGVPIALNINNIKMTLTLRLLLNLPRLIWQALGRDAANWYNLEFPALSFESNSLKQRLSKIETCTNEQLLDMLDRGKQLSFAAFFSRRHYMLTLAQPALLSVWVKRIFPAKAGPTEAKLLANIDHYTNRANQTLSKIAAIARLNPDEAKLLTQARGWLTDAPNSELIEQFEAFLSEFGSRELWMLGPTWQEKPEVVWQMLQSMLNSPSKPENHTTKALDDCLAQLISPLRPLFRNLVKHARNSVAMREDTHFIMMQGLALARQVALEMSRRLVQRGQLAQIEDVFFLLEAELRTALTSKENSEELVNSIKHRRTLYELAQQRGFIPSELLTSKNANSTVLKGVPASLGIVEGPARLIHSHAEFGRLQPGDILVCPYTNPAWTPLFNIAAGVVAEVGGVASHAAIVAREYQIPAVMGLIGALTSIKDGQLIRVNGQTGEVILLDQVKEVN